MYTSLFVFSVSLDFYTDFRNGTETVSIMFSKPEKRASWEESFNEAKQKLGKYLLGAVHVPTLYIFCYR